MFKVTYLSCIKTKVYQIIRLNEDDELTIMKTAGFLIYSPQRKEGDTLDSFLYKQSSFNFLS